jgi:diguanylate cyclase (GGDEF)-like protein
MQDGLRHETVYDILQDSSGFIWIASEGGVDRFDGYGFVDLFEFADVDDSLEALDVSSIVEDSSHRIWIGSWGNGLFLFDPSDRSLRDYRHDPTDKQSLTDNRVELIFEDSLGRIWIGTFRGLDLYRPEDASFQHIDLSGDTDETSKIDRIWAIQEGPQRELWIGSEHGLHRLNTTTNTTTSWRHVTGDPRSLAHPRVRSILIDDDHVWVGTQQGLDRFNLQTETVDLSYGRRGAELGDGTVTALLADRLGRLWIGTQRAGLFVFDEEKKKINSVESLAFPPTELGALDVRSIREDRTGLLWVATRGSGILLIDPKPPKFELLKPSWIEGAHALSNVVHAIVKDSRGRLWVGGESGLLCIENGRSKHYGTETRGGGLADDSVEALAAGEDDTLWIGTSAGLNWLDIETGKLIAFKNNPDDHTSLSNDQVESLLRTTSGQLWVGTRKGLNRLEADQRTFERYEVGSFPGLNDDYIRVLVEAEDGSVWVGTEVGGVFHLDLEGTIESFTHSPSTNLSLSSNRIMAMLEYVDKSIWIGTSKGLNRLDPLTGEVRRFGREVGLPSPSICGILTDQKNTLWVSTTRGLCRFDPAIARVRKVYSPADGLQGQVFSRGASFKASSGELFMGGLNGLNSFFPEQIQGGTTIPQIALTGFEIVNQPGASRLVTPATDRIELDYRDNAFYFEFAVLDYTSPQHNRFAYQLEGLESGWNYTGTGRSVTYSNVAPGEYTFRVRASNSDGVWNDQGLSVEIVMPPPFWQTRLFKLALFLLGVTIILLAVRARINSIRRRADQLRVLVEVRTAELASANARLRQLADSDGLTGIANHRRFYELLNEEWRRARRTGVALSIAMADIDSFKAFNDARGHLMGDECLKRVAEAIASTPGRTGDVVARYGGEEFAVVLIATEREGAVQVAESMRKAVEDLELPHPESAIAEHVTISVGVATAHPSQGSDPSQLVRKADAALYQAKQAGRNRVHCSDE